MASQSVEQSIDDGDVEKWDEHVLQQKLQEADMPQALLDVLSKWKTKGKDLKHLARIDVLMQEGLKWPDCLKFMDFLEKHGVLQRTKAPDLKVFNDPIHGNIQLPPACIAVIDTPQFQRLRYLKQLGPTYFVYPGAAHNRFEHCVGVCYLAGQFVRRLRENQSELGITDIDCLCVELAGLCHDLGHGPFSHLFDQKFLPIVTVRPQKSWKHEDGSVMMFDHLIKKNGLMEEGGKLRRAGIRPQDITFIKELIAGPLGHGSGDWPYEGRPKEKAFLFEIVANKRNGIDVDKFDYLARDCHQLGFRNNFDHDRYMKFARVCHLHGEMQICVRDKEVVNLYYMFFTRYNLHMNAYKHKVVSALEMMIAQALIKANDHVTILGEKGRCKIADCIDDPEAYTLLTDDILFKILDTNSDAQELREAQELIRRIYSRDLFKCLYQHPPVSTSDFQDLFGDPVEQRIQDVILKESPSLNRGDFYVQIVHKDFGMKEENPIKKLNVYSKNDLNKPSSITQDEISIILSPEIFKEYVLRIYSFDRDPEKCGKIAEAVETWIQKRKDLVQREKESKSS